MRRHFGIGFVASYFLIYGVLALPLSGAVTLGVDHTTLLFSATAGGSSPATQTLKVTASDNSAVGFTVTASTTSGGSWLQVSPGSANTTATLTVTVTLGALGANSYSGNIQIKPGNGAATVNVPVTFAVGSAPGSLRIDGGTSTTLSFSASAGDTSPTSDIANLTATGTADVTFKVNPPSASWVTVDTGGITKVTGGGDPFPCQAPTCVVVNVTRCAEMLIS